MELTQEQKDSLLKAWTAMSETERAEYMVWLGNTITTLESGGGMLSPHGNRAECIESMKAEREFYETLGDSSS
jgi:hypothetical protein